MFSNFPDAATIIDKGVCKDNCILAHSINEIVGYNLFGLFGLFFIFAFIIILLLEETLIEKTYKNDNRRRKNNY